MLEEELPVPRLYFYSADDQLCNVQQLETLLGVKQEQ